MEQYGGVAGLAREVGVSLSDGVVSSEIPLRQKTYGFNKCAEKPPKGFWVFVTKQTHNL